MAAILNYTLHSLSLLLASSFAASSAFSSTISSSSLSMFSFSSSASSMLMPGGGGGGTSCKINREGMWQLHYCTLALPREDNEKKKIDWKIFVVFPHAHLYVVRPCTCTCICLRYLSFPNLPHTVLVSL